MVRNTQKWSLFDALLTTFRHFSGTFRAFPRGLKRESEISAILGRFREVDRKSGISGFPTGLKRGSRQKSAKFLAFSGLFSGKFGSFYEISEISLPVFSYGQHFPGFPGFPGESVFRASF